MPKTRIWLSAFLKTFVWLIVPLCIFGFHNCYETYEEQEKFLTPFSVSVNSYDRGDGTQVDEHFRRPPGGAEHDKPYESKRGRMKLWMFLISAIGIASTSIFLFKGSSDISEYKKDKEYKDRKKSEQNRKNAVRAKIKSLNVKLFDNIPSNITKSGKAKCKFCNKRNYNKDLHIYFTAKVHNHFICKNCMSANFYGVGQNPKEYEKQRKFINEYYDWIILISDNIEKDDFYDFEVSKWDIRNVFDEKLNDLKRNCM